MSRKDRPTTPDGRYLVARGRLKRCTNPALPDSTRRKYIKALMQARMTGARTQIDAAKIALGEAGPVWWDDGAPAQDGISPDESSYAQWWAALCPAEQAAGLR